MNRLSTEESQSHGNMGYDAIMMDICHYTIVQTKSIPYSLGKGMHVREQRTYGKSLYIPLNFATNPKFL